MRISDWSSDVCSSDLPQPFQGADSLGSDLLWSCVGYESAFDAAVFIERGHLVPDSAAQSRLHGNPRRAPYILEQIRVGGNRRRRSTDPVNLLYPFEVDRIHVVRRNRAAVPSDRLEACSVGKECVIPVRLRCVPDIYKKK